MVSKYFNYVLVLAMLIGVSAPLPQVKNQITSLLDSTTISSNSALAFGSVTSSPLQSQCSTPEQVINILARAGIIPTSKVNDAFRIVKSLPGSDGSPVPVPENKGTASSTATTTSARVVVSNFVITKGSVTTSPNGTWLVAYPQISFTITNLGNNPIYTSKTPVIAVATTSSVGRNGSTTISSITATGSTTGDTSTSYIINGSRTFTYNFIVDNTNGTAASKRIGIVQINYGTVGTPGLDNTFSIRDRLENAYVIVP